MIFHVKKKNLVNKNKTKKRKKEMKEGRKERRKEGRIKTKKFRATVWP